MVDVYVPVGGGASVSGVVGGMAVLVAAVVLAGLAVLVAVVAMFPSSEGSTSPSTTRVIGPCEPFCGARPTIPTTVTVGGEQR
ncbi:hypothetical protein [Nocardia bovistercoris]|uniref:hypothetical protein n=1 Tax=Nocardia bovistercoris TaxID=2785916 RepID=UPI002FCD4626